MRRLLRAWYVGQQSRNEQAEARARGVRPDAEGTQSLVWNGIGFIPTRLAGIREHSRHVSVATCLVTFEKPQKKVALHLLPRRVGDPALPTPRGAPPAR